MTHAAPIDATIMDRLRAETQPFHDRAESHAFQQALASGTIDASGYIAWLGQMFLVHRALERGLRTLAAGHHAVAAVVREEQYQEPYLRADLTTFGVTPESLTPLAGVCSVLAEIDHASATSPIDLLGMHYVLEGSNNGNRIIAVAVRKALALTPGAGDRYLNPYGERQRTLWQEFKADMNAQRFTPHEQERILAGAAAMFTGIARVSDDLAPYARRG